MPLIPHARNVPILFNINAPAFSPIDLSPIVWFKADAGTFQDTGLTTPATADAAAVKGWQDQSGNSQNATEATNNPILKLNIQNSLPVVRFDGINDVLATASIAHGIGTGNFYSASLVIPRALDSNNVYVAFGGAVLIDLVAPRAANKLGIFAGFEREFTTVLAANTTYILEIWRDGTTIRAAINGSLDATTFSINGSLDTSVFSLGKGLGLSTSFGNVDIGETVLYASYSAAMQTSVRAYLNTRWAAF